MEESVIKNQRMLLKLAKRKETNKNVESNQEVTEEVDKVMLEVAVKQAN